MMQMSRPMRRAPLLKTAVAPLVLSLAACGGGISEDEFRSELTDGGLSTEQANCIIDGLGAAGIPLEDVTDQALGDDDPPQEVIDITIACVSG